MCVVDYFWSFYRLQTIYRLARGGQSYKIDIYLRNWSIRTELKRRACLYNIENESFSQPELSLPTEQRLNRNDENNISRNSGIGTTDALPMTATTVYPFSFLSGQQQTYEIHSNTANDNDQNHDNRVADQQGQQQQQHHRHQQQDLLYQKQYCNQIKVIRSDLMHTNDVKIEIISEINTTARKHTTVSATPVNDNLKIDTLRILCEKNDLIVDRCGTWKSKNIRNFNVRKAIIDTKQRSTTTDVSSSTHPNTKNPTNVVKKLRKTRPLTAVGKCKSDKTAKPLPPPQHKLKTQNTFISRLFLTDILENI